MDDEDTQTSAECLMRSARLTYWAQPMEERAVVTHQRKAALRYFQITREKLAADPTATPDDLQEVDAFVRFSEQKLDAIDLDLKADRRREKTRERVRRHRARKLGGG